MDDEELTRLAIAELVREMGEVPPDTNIRERKINPIAKPNKPNKRFLGRTLNSIVTHNRREKERTHQNCQRKLQELDDTRRRYDERELSLSTSTGDERRDTDKDDRGKRSKKTTTRKRRSEKRESRKTKKSKSKRRPSSSDSSSRSSTSRNHIRSRKHKKYKKQKSINVPISKNEEKDEVEEANVYYGPCANVDMNLNPSLWMNCYGDQQMQQLLQYNRLLEDRETAENKDVLEELQMSDVDGAEQQKMEVASISTGVSSLRLDDESTTDSSGVLQISVSSGSSSSSSAAADYKIMRKKRLKKGQIPKKNIPEDSPNCIVLELDSDSSNACKAAEDQVSEQKQEESEDCICIVSGGSSKGSDVDRNVDSSDSSASLTYNDETESETSIPNKINNAATDTVMLVTTSSDSEVEVVVVTEAKSPRQDKLDKHTEAILNYNINANISSVAQSTDNALSTPLNLTYSSLSPSDMVGMDLSTASNSLHKSVDVQVEQLDIVDPEAACGDLNIEKQSDSGPRDELSLEVQSPNTYLNTNDVVGIDLSAKAISQTFPIELQIEQKEEIVSESRRECGDSQAEQKEQIASKSVSEIVAEETAQPSFLDLKNNDMVGIDLSTTSISTSPTVEFPLVVQTPQSESEQSSNLEVLTSNSNSNPSDIATITTSTSTTTTPAAAIVGIDLSHKIVSESLDTDSGNVAVLAAQTLSSNLKLNHMVGIDLSTKSNLLHSSMDFQEIQHKNIEPESLHESPSYTIPTTDTISKTTTSTTPSPPQVVIPEAETATQDVELCQSLLLTAESYTNQLVRNPNPPSPCASSCTHLALSNENDLVSRESTTGLSSEETNSIESNKKIGSIADGLAEISTISLISSQSDSSTTSTASDSSLDCEQNSHLSVVVTTMPVDEQMTIDSQPAGSDFKRSGSPPPPIS